MYLPLDWTIYENEQIQEIDALYHIFTREIESQKVVKKLVSNCLDYLGLRKKITIATLQQVEHEVKHSS